MAERTGVGWFSETIGHPTDLNLAGVTSACGRIDKDHALSAARGLGQLRAQLVQRNNFDFVGQKPSFQHFSCPPRYAVVGAQPIPVRDDEDASHDLECIFL